MDKSRIYEILTDDDILKSINDNIDYLLKIIPEIKYMIGFDHKHPHHHLDVFNHTLYALSLSENDFEIRLCLLLHDIGKPFSYIEGDIRNFSGHPKVSAKMSKEILNRLSYDEEFINEVCFLIENHDIPIRNSLIKENNSLVYKLYKIQYCDALAHNPERLEKRKLYLEKTLRKIEGERI